MKCSVLCYIFWENVRASNSISVLKLKFLFCYNLMNIKYIYFILGILGI